MECLSPVYIGHGVARDGNTNLFVPCGKCVPCLKKRRAVWTLRLVEEDRSNINGYFITLTYGEKVPINVDPETGEVDMVLQYDHVQKWLKAMRQRKHRYFERQTIKTCESAERPVRFFAVGEFGDKGGRPHYHILLWNYPKAQIAKDTGDAWKHGRVHIGTVTEASIHYTAKYSLKKENKAWMSRRPGIGHSYLEEIGKYHKLRDQYYISKMTEDGKRYKMPMPRYWKERLEAGKKKKKEIKEELIKEKDKLYNEEIARLSKKYENPEWEYERRIRKANDKIRYNKGNL